MYTMRQPGKVGASGGRSCAPAKRAEATNRQ